MRCRMFTCFIHHRDQMLLLSKCLTLFMRDCSRWSSPNYPSPSPLVGDIQHKVTFSRNPCLDCWFISSPVRINNDTAAYHLIYSVNYMLIWIKVIWHFQPDSWFSNMIPTFPNSITFVDLNSNPLKMLTEDNCWCSSHSCLPHFHNLVMGLIISDVTVNVHQSNYCHSVKTRSCITCSIL